MVNFISSGLISGIIIPEIWHVTRLERISSRVHKSLPHSRVHTGIAHHRIKRNRIRIWSILRLLSLLIIKISLRFIRLLIDIYIRRLGIIIIFERSILLLLTLVMINILRLGLIIINLGLNFCLLISRNIEFILTVIILRGVIEIISLCINGNILFGFLCWFWEKYEWRCIWNSMFLIFLLLSCNYESVIFLGFFRVSNLGLSLLYLF